MKKLDRKKKSEGLGDDIAKLTNLLYLDRLAKEVARLFGQEDCGCDRRKDKLNELVPYKKEKNVKRRTNTRAGSSKNGEQ
jgi:hypothetical protein